LARKKSLNLTEAELRLMDIVWDKGPVTVGEVAAGLPGEPGLAYNTILTTLRILEQKGYVRHTKPREGRAFVYRAVVGRKQASRNALRHLIRGFFANSPELLVLNLLDDGDLSPRALQNIRNLLGEGEK
jgi:predicted transcriptional regulator